MRRTEVKPITDAERSEIIRRLKDKYVDRYGYPKKIVIDDCLNQFIRQHDYAPSAQDLKELDVVMKKRVMGKDVQYSQNTEQSRGGPAGPGERSSGAYKPGSKSVTNLKADPNMPIGKSKKDKTVELVLPDVTGKITSMPAPKLKKKKKPTQTGPQEPEPLKPSLDEAAAASIMRGENTDVMNGKHKLNRWGILEVYKSQQFEKEKSNQAEKKKEVIESYKKILDEQMNEQRQIKKLQDITKQTSQLRISGPEAARLKKNVSEADLLREYDSLQKEMQRNHVLPSREIEINNLQNKLSWANTNVGKPSQSVSEKQAAINKYKDVLDRQLEEKTNTQASVLKDDEKYRKIYQQAGEDLQKQTKDNQDSKKKRVEDYVRMLDSQIALKKQIDTKDMNDQEFKLNKDLLQKATQSLVKKKVPA